ncbi:Putative SET domain-containing protein [Septoria linicola]|uniref:Histone-lysine N-methyltransferase SET5 n=1 Tax=Septoria linicola TaxID=215465 RepID=A0A9Q9AJA9_9PEZI|nr:putative SET domain-containing protein [Septoria linicola]USW47203.1 Putative SET domain-containing protein [Septoria linicola]
MDRPFAASGWVPTKPLETWEQHYTEEFLTELLLKLGTNTKHIRCRPYDATTWMARAQTLSLLRYPELAVGDAHKAGLLCKALLSVLEGNTRPNYRLGANAGFWMRHEDPEEEYYEEPPVPVQDLDLDLDEEHDSQAVKFDTLLFQADKIVSDNLEYYPSAEMGRYSPQAYPWVQKRHTWRTPEVLDQINQEFSSTAESAACIAKRNAFDGATDGMNILGVFATRDIAKGETVLVDRSKIFGCAGPKQADLIVTHLDDGETVQRAVGGAANLHGGQGCSDVLHPNDEDDDVEHDLRWIRDQAGAEAPHIIMTARLFLICVQDGVDHPLDHKYIARLTPHYRNGVMKSFYLENDFNVMTQALQRFGIDIFANENFDTWVIFTVEARGSNNAWSNSIASCLNPLFSLINHSCEPNLTWKTHSDHRSLHVMALRDIKQGEQLFVEYDGYQHDVSYKERRESLSRWLDGDCKCTRCVREEQFEKELEAIARRRSDVTKNVTGSDSVYHDEAADAVPDLNIRTSAWDDSEPAELPEDGVEEGKWETVRKRATKAMAEKATAKKKKSSGNGRKHGKATRKDSFMS